MINEMQEQNEAELDDYVQMIERILGNHNNKSLSETSTSADSSQEEEK